MKGRILCVGMVASLAAGCAHAGTDSAAPNRGPHATPPSPRFAEQLASCVERLRRPQPAGVTPATPQSSPLGKTLDDMRREDDELRREHTPDEALSRGGTRPAAPAPGAAPGRSRCPAWQAGPVGGCSRALPRARGGVGRRRSCVASCRVSRTLGDEPVVLGPIAHGTPSSPTPSPGIRGHRGRWLPGNANATSDGSDPSRATLRT